MFFFGNFLNFLQLSWLQLQNAQNFQNLMGHVPQCPLAFDATACSYFSVLPLPLPPSTSLPSSPFSSFSVCSYRPISMNDVSIPLHLRDSYPRLTNGTFSSEEPSANHLASNQEVGSMRNPISRSFLFSVLHCLLLY